MSEDLDRNFARIVKLAEAAGLPDVSVGTSYGTPALLVKDKSFARMKDDETLVVMLSNVAGGATVDGSSMLTVTITNDDSTAPSGGGGGGGGALAIEILFLVGAALAAIRPRKHARGSGFSRATGGSGFSRDASGSGFSRDSLSR